VLTRCVAILALRDRGTRSSPYQRVKSKIVPFIDPHAQRAELRTARR
jgi:hypothetical protein